MAYSALDDIKKMLPESELVALTDDEGLDSINQDRVDEAIASADAEIDGYLGVRYSVPLGTTPALVKKLSVDIAIYTLYSRTVQSCPEIRTDRYKAAIKKLEAIAAGKISLGIAQEPDPATPDSGAETNQSSSSQVFGRDKMEGF